MRIKRSELSEQDIGGKERESMKKQIKYSDEPISAKAVDDFFPSPEELVLKDEKVKVTISLSN